MSHKNDPRFNYIITIHNKEDMIEEVISAVLMCCRDNSYIYPILDGCTDKTEEIIDGIISKNSGVPITKLYAPDVHELLSINIGLKTVSQEGVGYNIVLQDDVVLADFQLEKKIIEIYRWAGKDLGYLSLRMGADFKKDAYFLKESVPMTDYVENAYGHGLSSAKPLMPGYFVYKQIAIKSPVCFPFQLIRKIGILDEKLAPYGNDDLEYAIRCHKAGFKNGVLALRFYSDVKWGTTRLKPHPKMAAIHQKNMDNIRTWYGKDLEKVAMAPKSNKSYKVSGMATDEEIKTAKTVWERNQNMLKDYQNNQKKPSTVSLLMKAISRVIKKNV